MKIILTSAGFDNRNLISHVFKLTEKKGFQMKALFIPTALDTPESKKAIPVFLEDLYCLGIKKDNITTYNLEEPYVGNINIFDVMLFTAGNPEFLLNRINEAGFKKEIEKFLSSGGIFIGISAGSDIVGKNFKDGLGYINAIIECHSSIASKTGQIIPKGETIKLSDNQALVAYNDCFEIVE